jgi:hypothetical protein
MTLKEQIIQEIEQIPDSLLSQLLDFLLFIKVRHIEEDVEDLTEEERACIVASQDTYQEGDYLTLEKYEVSQR